MPRPWLRNVVVITVTLAALVTTSAADVLIYKSGRRKTGKITDVGNAYVLTDAKGGKIKIPKQMVREVLTEEQLQDRLAQRLAGTDAQDDEQVEALLKFLRDYGLSDKRQSVLEELYTRRHDAAKGDPDALRALSEWCSKYHLRAQSRTCLQEAFIAEFPARLEQAKADPTQLEKLAAQCNELGLADQARQCLASQYEQRKAQASTPQDKWQLAEWCDAAGMAQWRDQCQLDAIEGAAGACDVVSLEGFLRSLQDARYSRQVRSACAREIFKLRLAEADQDAKKLAELSIWCGWRGLTEQRGQAETAALAAAPDDADVRKMLGYEKNKAGEWVKVPQWKFDVVKAVTTETYNENRGPRKISYTAKGTDTRLAVIRVSFEVVTGCYGDPNDRLAPVANLLGTKYAKKLLPPGDLRDQPWRIFQSDRVRLEIDGQELAPVYTGTPMCPGIDVPTGENDKPTVWTLKDPNEIALAFARTRQVTYLAVRPGGKTALELLYLVPSDATEAKLLFYDLEPKSLTLSKGPSRYNADRSPRARRRNAGSEDNRRRLMDRERLDRERRWFDEERRRR